MKRHVTDWENIFARHISHRGFMSMNKNPQISIMTKQPNGSGQRSEHINEDTQMANRIEDDHHH